VLYAVLALHIGGALKHELIDRESVLRRMLP
jgi:cytochrome b561